MWTSKSTARPARACDLVQRERLELGLGVARKLLVDAFFVQVRDSVQHDDSAAGVRHRGHVSDEVEPSAGRAHIELIPQRDPLGAALGFCGTAQESARVYQRLKPPSELIT